MIFCNHIKACHAVQHHLEERGFACTAFHSNVPPKTRNAFWQSFVDKNVSICVCSDVAMRGMDTTFVEHVIMFDFPTNSRSFIHRTGRTSRGASATGKVSALVNKKEQF